MKQSIAALTLVVRDYDEAIAWYTGKLGFERALLPAAVQDDKSGLKLSGFRTLGSFVEHMLGR